MMIIRVVVTVVISVSIVIIVIVVVVTIVMMVIVRVMVIRVSISVSVVVIILFFISKYGMTESSNSMNCMMSNSSYSSDSVVNKSEEKVSVVVINFKSVFYKLVHNFVCQIIYFFISKYGMTESSNSMNCMMSNSS